MPIMASIWSAIMWLLFLSITAVAANNPCVPYVPVPLSGRLVCVCNATYCDTVDEVPDLKLGEYVQYSSNQKGLRFEKTFGLFEDVQQADAIQFTLNITETFQTILGFGGAFTDAAGININELSVESQDNLLKSYFSPEGIELNFGRVPIGGCDFSEHQYTYDDVENDTELANFNLTVEDFTYKIPFIKRAIELSQNEMKFVCAAWSPPIWMKTSHAFPGGYLYEDYYQTWADYLIKFLDAYKDEGIEFWSISTGNEPLGGILPVYGFNSLGWTPESQFRWVRDNLAPTLRNSQHNLTKILTIDDQRAMLPWWLNAMKSDTKAAELIDGIGIHWYLDDFFPPILLDRTHDEFPDKFMLGTEACMGDKPWQLQLILGSWARGEKYMENIIEDLNHWVGGWIDWNLALSETGGPNWAGNFVDAAIIVPNDGSDRFYKNPMFYALGHFSKFVTAGSVRVKVTPEAENGVQTIAFNTLDNSVVFIVYNKNDLDIAVTLTDSIQGHINLLVTGKSFQTIIYKYADKGAGHMLSWSYITLFCFIFQLLFI